MEKKLIIMKDKTSNLSVYLFPTFNKSEGNHPALEFIIDLPSQAVTYQDFYRTRKES